MKKKSINTDPATTVEIIALYMGWEPTIGRNDGFSLQII